jgi:hypothetical protein
MRSWIEDSFKDIKSDGWQWQKTRMTDPKRATRFWPALAVASLWVISLGGEADALSPDYDLSTLPPNHIAHRAKSRLTRQRIHSCFARGVFKVLIYSYQPEAHRFGCLYP